jgi:hypothetical protein
MRRMKRCFILIGGVSVAGVYALVNATGGANLGLGWSVTPGPILLMVLIATTLLAVMRERPLVVIQVAGCFLASMLVEFAPIPATLQGFVGIGLVLVGEIALVNNDRLRPSTIMFVLLGGYIEAVWIYGFLVFGQAMYFFKPGWTF